MAKNALQEQLLKAGLVDSKKAKKISKQSQHAKRTGDASNLEAKKALADAQAKKIEKDQKLNQEKQQLLEEKTLRANVIQMIKQHQITETQGDIVLPVPLVGPLSRVLAAPEPGHYRIHFAPFTATISGRTCKLEARAWEVQLR